MRTILTAGRTRSARGNNQRTGTFAIDSTATPCCASWGQIMDSEKSRSKRKTPKTSKPKTLPVRGKSAGRAAGAPGNVAVIPLVKPEERRQMIALAAYYRAEQRGFVDGDPLQDWLEAEAEVTMRLRDVEAGTLVS